MKKIIMLIVILVLCLWIVGGEWTWPLGFGKIEKPGRPARIAPPGGTP
jgi:hypothetical protein